MSRPFVVTIASEKGGVGKTTIATNLAVYLKALREDLPVTIASFDNHFSIDQMFALGPRPQQCIADLLAEAPLADLCALGQYGVQYVASSRRLTPPAHQPAWLRQCLYRADQEGVLLLDTRPILDWFTEAALLAADLVLVPVKDRAALVNAAALRDVLAGVGRADLLWLLPSLVDVRARLNAEVRVHDFLVYSAKERDYQVLDMHISKSPKVESLASGFSSRVLPVLTHARNTAVHGQFRKLGEFVLRRYDEGGPSVGHTAADLHELPAGRRRQMVAECPVCCRQSLDEVGSLFFDLRSRRKGLLHKECLEQILDGLELQESVGEEGLLALTLDGPGMLGPEPRWTMHLLNPKGELVVSEGGDLQDSPALAKTVTGLTGRHLDASYRELSLIKLVPGTLASEFAGAGYENFCRLRRKALRELRQAGLF